MCHAGRTSSRSTRHQEIKLEDVNHRLHKWPLHLRWFTKNLCRLAINRITWDAIENSHGFHDGKPQWFKFKKKKKKKTICWVVSVGDIFRLHVTISQGQGEKWRIWSRVFHWFGHLRANTAGFSLFLQHVERDVQSNVTMLLCDLCGCQILCWKPT